MKVRVHDKTKSIRRNLKMQKNYSIKMEISYVCQNHLMDFEDKMQWMKSNFLYDFSTIVHHYNLSNVHCVVKDQVFEFPKYQSVSDAIGDMIAHDDVDMLHRLCAKYRDFYEEYKHRPGRLAPFSAWICYSNEHPEEPVDSEYTMVFTVMMLGKTDSSHSLDSESMRTTIKGMCGCDDVCIISSHEDVSEESDTD